MSRETLMHLDGCHFFVWVYRVDERYFLTFQDREGDDLYLHARTAGDDEEPCERCNALTVGLARPRRRQVDLDPLPDDPKESFVAVLTRVGEIDEGAA